MECATQETVSQSPAKGLGGAPRHNQNAVKHGLKAETMIRLNKVPAEAEYIAREVRRFRSWVREAVSELRGGPLTIYDEALANTAARHELRASLAARWLRLAGDLTIEQKLTLMKTVSDASDARDRCLQRLGLDRRDQTERWIADLYGPVTPQSDHSDSCRKTGPQASGGPQTSAASETSTETAEPAIAAHSAAEKRTGQTTEHGGSET
jgi:hypothetical protein